MAVPRPRTRLPIASVPAALLALLLLLAVTACGDDPDDSVSGDDGDAAAAASVTPEDLDGRSFSTSNVDGYTLVEDTTVSLSFEDGLVGATAGCNNMSGGYEITDGALVVAQMAQTMMACPDDLAAQDQWLVEFLQSSPEIALDGETLTLTGADASMGLAEAGSDSVGGRTWAMISLESPDATLTAPEGASVTFTDGSLSVATGCNTAFGEATVDGDTVTVGPLGSTRMACDADLMEWESAVLEFLDGELTFALDGDDLTLTKDDATMTLREIPVE